MDYPTKQQSTKVPNTKVQKSKKLQKNVKKGKNCKNHKKYKIKQDQGSKAPSRDYPNISFMTRLDYMRVED